MHAPVGGMSTESPGRGRSRTRRGALRPSPAATSEPGARRARTAPRFELGGQRLDERTQRGDCRIRRALRERRVGGRPEDVDDPILAASRHLLDMRDDPLDRGVEPEQEPRRTLVAQLELALCEVAVDGGLHERVDEAERRPGTQDLRTSSPAATTASSSSPASPPTAASSAPSPGRRPSEPPAPQRAGAAPAGGAPRATRLAGRARRPGRRATRPAAPAPPERLQSSLSRNGLPCVEAWHASAKTVATPRLIARARPPRRRSR